MLNGPKSASESVKALVAVVETGYCKSFGEGFTVTRFVVVSFVKSS